MRALIDLKEKKIYQACMIYEGFFYENHIGESNCNMATKHVFPLTLFRVGFYRQPTIQQLIQSDLEFRFLARFQLSRSIQLGSSPCAGLQRVTQSNHLLKECCPQLVSKPHLSGIQPPKQLGYRSMPLSLTNITVNIT